MAVRRTKIVATLGPASREPEQILALLNAGVDVCRINCSHASADGIREAVARIRRVAASLDRPVGILLDLQGPKIRTSMVEKPLLLNPGDILTVVMDDSIVGSGKRVGTTYTRMAGDVKTGDLVLFADGALSGQVAEVRRDIQPAEVDIRIEDGGELGSKKGINLPGVATSVPSLTEKDIADLEVGVRAGVDFVALSFVREGADVVRLRSHLRRLEHPDLPVIAKIEKPQGVANIQEILPLVEGIMVARGDLGVEVNLERVPVIQKDLISAANRAGVLVI
ncbi:MAG TPA: pyruvate kinase, partial [Myxococcota bacterium]|nr:pyruvate kinase [Myxococcota bacterium]